MYEQYMGEMDCLKSCSTVLQEMYYNKKIQSKKYVSNNQNLSKLTKERKYVPVVQDFSTDDSVIIGIQNDLKFINIILNSRKQKAPLAYIFVESEYRYVTCIIKNPDGFPLVMLRLPINKKVAYAKNTNNCYEFPIVDIVNKDTKFNKSYSYTMMFRHDGQSIQFIFDIYSGTPEPNRIVVNDIKVGNLDIIETIFKTEMVMVPQVISDDFTLHNTASLLTFNNMNVMILAEVNPNNVITFANRLYCRTKNYFKLTATHLYYVTETNKKHNDTYICSEEDSYYWNIVETNTRVFEMNAFEPLFKINYSKTLATTDKIYYVFTSFLENFMFIKIITSLDLSSCNNITSFIGTFHTEYQIIEAYLCNKC